MERQPTFGEFLKQTALYALPVFSATRQSFSDWRSAFGVRRSAFGVQNMSSRWVSATSAGRRGFVIGLFLGSVVAAGSLLGESAGFAGLGILATLALYPIAGLWAGGVLGWFSGRLDSPAALSGAGFIAVLPLAAVFVIATQDSLTWAKGVAFTILIAFLWGAIGGPLVRVLYMLLQNKTTKHNGDGRD